ncbi:MAG: transcriptional repressor LexA [Anaerolineae bacterium]|nr:transcriptional repressor LexA [Anaerolineae bacterium]
MKDFNKLSKRQRNILIYMEGYVEKHGFPPTIREIGTATDINSTSVVNYNLNKLVQAGYLERSGRVSRGIRMVGEIPGDDKKKVKVAQAPVSIPLVGQIVAGEPVPPFEANGDSIEVTPAMLGNANVDDVFALRVKGDSMIDAMIADGDIVLLRRVSTARNGDMVAVWLDERGETTLKRFYLEPDRIRLQPENPTMQPIYVHPAHCQIQGKVVSVIRPFRQ